MTERLYYEDSFLRSFPARVVDIREASRNGGVSIWQIALDRTAFYPTSGGQPCDTGVLTATSRNGAVLEIPIESVEEEDSEDGSLCVWHITGKPLQAGTAVQGSIDWPRRLDHIQQHSGQHLLSAIFARELDAQTVSFHLGETVSSIDLAVGAIAHHSLERVERIANEIIAEDRPVSIRTVERAEAEKLLAEGFLRKLPERESPIRLIEIANCDLNACGGTHVRSTGQIGSVLVRGTERVSRGLRVEFVCGLRAVTSARHDFELLGRTVALLSIGRNDVPAAIERLQVEAKSSAKERQKLRDDLATYHATRLAIEEMIEDNLRLIRRTFTDRDRDYVRLLASRVCATVPRTVALFVSEEAEPTRIFLACSRDMNLNCGEFLRSALAAHGLRGGGSSDLAQGDAPKIDAEKISAGMAANLRSMLARPHAMQ
ncbi:MAG: alanyl-tRNA editing protein [Acidobacteriaceae bacterium]|nr:alanyl-tRNA editing protein [Acidobacteriaceae bacterium]